MGGVHDFEGDTLTAAIAELDELTATAASMTGPEAADELDGLFALRRSLDAATTAVARRWETSGEWALDGSRSAAARLARDQRLSKGTGRKVLCRGGSLAEMPATTDAFNAGRLTADFVDLLARVNTAGRADQFARDEQVLVDEIAGLRYDQAVKVIDYWKRHADVEAGNDGDAPTVEPWIRITPGVNGEFHLSGELDPIGGAEIREAIERIANELRLNDRDQPEDERRDAGRRRHDAMVELVRRANAAPANGRKPRPLVTIVAGDETFARLCERDDGVVLRDVDLHGHLRESIIETILFQDSMTTVSKSPQRTFTGALRRAVQVRDRHCQHDSGCDEPINRCDVDHDIPHSRHGPTALWNGKLKCHYHNRIWPNGAQPP